MHHFCDKFCIIPRECIFVYVDLSCLVADLNLHGKFGLTDRGAKMLSIQHIL